MQVARYTMGFEKQNRPKLKEATEGWDSNEMNTHQAAFSLFSAHSLPKLERWNWRVVLLVCQRQANEAGGRTFDMASIGVAVAVQLVAGEGRKQEDQDCKTSGMSYDITSTMKTTDVQSTMYRVPCTMAMASQMYSEFGIRASLE